MRIRKAGSVIRSKKLERYLQEQRSVGLLMKKRSDVINMSATSQV